MNCVGVRRYLSPYLDSELGPETSFDIALHLDGCAACHRRVEGERALEAELGRALQRLEAHHRQAWDRALAAAVERPVARRPALAAVAVAIVASVAIAFQWSRSGPGAGASAAVPHPPAARSSELARHRAREAFQQEIEDMKPTTLLGAAFAVSVAGATSTSLLLAPEVEPTAGAAAGDSVVIAALLERQTELEATVAELRTLLESRGADGPGDRATVRDEQELEQLVARLLDERTASREPAGSAEPGGSRLLAAALVRELVDPRLGDAERAALWKRIVEKGLIDEAVAEFERRAEAAPFDPVARTELGWAYFQKMATTHGGPETGRWGAKGADAMLKALELDETSWDARFTLAQHYSYADMRGDSIRHLELLIEQQARRAPLAKHARAYLLLGNLHVDQGRTAEARAAWTEGLRHFPNDASLLERLRTFD